MTRALWLLRRLTVMSPAEVASRTRREVGHGFDDLLHRASPALWRRTWCPPPRPHPTRARRPLGFLTHDRAELVRKIDPRAADEIVAAANHFLDGRVDYFGYGEVELGCPLDFSLDPRTHQRWPERHGKRLDYRRAAYGDPKWIWELNRLQELPLLIQAWLLTDEDVYAAAAVAHARRFVDTVDPGRGVAWSNGYEAGLRAISLALTLDALRGWPLLAAEDERRLLDSLWQHRRWIQHDPSTHSSANNHLIGELVGLVVISLLAPELGGRTERALAELAREASLQVAADGSGAEQAFSYSLHVLDQLLLVAALLELRSRQVPRGIRSALERGADALAAQLGPGEPPPRYGDADDAWVVRLDGSALRDERAVCASLTAYLGHAGARRAGERLDSGAVWLFGTEGARIWSRTQPALPPGSVLLPDAGLAILRAGRRRLLFDAGPLGYLSLGAHGHADAGTAVHATVEIDEVDQSVSGGPFLWTRHAEARLLHVDLEAGVVAGEHEGYERLTPPARHRRLVRLLAEGPVLVHDRITTAGPHRIVQSWPLAPELEVVSVEEGSARIEREGQARMVLVMAGTVEGTLGAARGELDPPRGWYSSRLEAIEPAWRLGWVAHVEGTVDIVSLLWPFDLGAAWPIPCLSIQRSDAGLLVGYDAGDERIELVLA